MDKLSAILNNYSITCLNLEPEHLWFQLQWLFGSRYSGMKRRVLCTDVRKIRRKTLLPLSGNTVKEDAIGASETLTPLYEFARGHTFPKNRDRKRLWKFAIGDMILTPLTSYCRKKKTHRVTFTMICLNIIIPTTSSSILFRQMLVM